MYNMLYKLTFSSPVHFGKGRLNSSDVGITADTLFSAIFKELIKEDEKKAHSFYTACKTGAITFTDLFPYSEDKYFIPKPFVHVEAAVKGDSSVKKSFKKLSFIPFEDLPIYMSGNYDPKKTVEFGISSVRTRVAVNYEGDNLPYNVGLWQFNNNSGLYLLARANEEDHYLFGDALYSLEYTGIGGKISSGLGKFTCVEETPSKQMEDSISQTGSLYMTLATAMATNEELEDTLAGATFNIVKRSGFVASEKYSETPLKKRDMYCFSSGSCFKNRFNGDIFDVSTEEGSHPVYRYARPFFITVR